jgi:hypothetical protein
LETNEEALSCVRIPDTHMSRQKGKKQTNNRVTDECSLNTTRIPLLFIVKAIVYSKVGRFLTFFYIFNQRQTEIRLTPSKSVENRIKVYWVNRPLSDVMTFWVMHDVRVQIYFHNVGFMNIKRRIILGKFQKY